MYKSTIVMDLQLLLDVESYNCAEDYFKLNQQNSLACKGSHII